MAGHTGERVAIQRPSLQGVLPLPDNGALKDDLKE